MSRTFLSESDDFPAQTLAARFAPHRDALYALAETLTLDGEEGARLAERAFARALADAEAGLPVDDEQAFLCARALAIRREEKPELSSERREALVASSLQARLPGALPLLSEERRTLLFFLVAQSMSVERAAGLLGIEAVSVPGRLNKALDALYRAVLAGASPEEAERLAMFSDNELLRTSLAAAWPTGEAAVLRVPSEAVPPPAPPRLRHEPVAPRVAALPARRNLLGALAAFVLIIAAGLAGLTLSRSLEGGGDTDLIASVTEQSGALTVVMDTDDPRRAERYVHAELKRRVELPDIEGATLTGVAFSVFGDGVEVPVFIYNDAEGEGAIRLFAFSYAALDRLSDEATLADDVLARIEDDSAFDIHDRGENKAVVWRSRDDVFIAVTTGDANRLRERIAPPA